MSWVALGLVSALLYAAVNFIDKHLVANLVRDHRSMPVFTGIVAALAVPLLVLASGGGVALAPTAALVVIATGVITSWSLFLYFRALAEADTTVVVILFQMVPAWTLLLAFVVLGERPSVPQLLGVALMIGAVAGISLEGADSSTSTRPVTIALVLLFTVLWALTGVMIKAVLTESALGPVVTHESVGIAVGGLVALLVPGVRRPFLVSVRSVPRRAFALIAIDEAVFLVAKLASFAAYVLGPVALVGAVLGTQTFFAMAIGMTLTVLLPRAFREDVRRRTVIRRAALAGLMVAGILLIGA